MMFKQRPCFKCEDRNGDCHSECSKYLEWRKEYDKFLSQVNKEKAIAGQLKARKNEVFDRKRKGNFK